MLLYIKNVTASCIDVLSHKFSRSKFHNIYSTSDCSVLFVFICVPLSTPIPRFVFQASVPTNKLTGRQADTIYILSDRRKTGILAAG